MQTETGGTNAQSSVADGGEAPLPLGWAMSRAANGRPFFIDHNSKTTTWVCNQLSDWSISYVFIVSLVDLNVACVRVCVRVCVRACVRACVCVCVCVCV
jgi:hypothetical protein